MRYPQGTKVKDVVLDILSQRDDKPGFHGSPEYFWQSQPTLEAVADRIVGELAELARDQRRLYMRSVGMGEDGNTDTHSGIYVPSAYTGVLGTFDHVADWIEGRLDDPHDFGAQRHGAYQRRRLPVTAPEAAVQQAVDDADGAGNQLDASDDGAYQDR